MCVVIMLLIDEGHLVFPHVSASCLGKGNTVSFLFPTPSACLILFFLLLFFSPFFFLFFSLLMLFTWQGTIYTSHVFTPNLFMSLTFEISITSLWLLEFWHFSSLFFPLNNSQAIPFLVLPKETTVSAGVFLVFFQSSFYVEQAISTFLLGLW